MTPFSIRDHPEFNIIIRRAKDNMKQLMSRSNEQISSLLYTVDLLDYIIHYWYTHQLMHSDINTTQCLCSENSTTSNMIGIFHPIVLRLCRSTRECYQRMLVVLFVPKFYLHISIICSSGETIDIDGKIVCPDRCCLTDTVDNLTYLKHS